MKVKCFPYKRYLQVFSAITACTGFFSFSFPQVPQQKEQALRLVTIKPIFPKGKNNLTTKQIDTLEKYVVKIHSTGLRHKSEGASLCDQDFL